MQLVVQLVHLELVLYQHRLVVVVLDYSVALILNGYSCHRLMEGLASMLAAQSRIH